MDNNNNNNNITIATTTTATTTTSNYLLSLHKQQQTAATIINVNLGTINSVVSIFLLLLFKGNNKYYPTQATILFEKQQQILSYRNSEEGKQATSFIPISPLFLF